MKIRINNTFTAFLLAGALVSLASASETHAAQYVAVDTGQTDCYSMQGEVITCRAEGEMLYGQDAQYDTNAPSFTLTDDELVTDNNTGLMWQKAHNETRLNYDAATTACSELVLGGYSDWRLPNIKELMTIVDFSGTVSDNDATEPDDPYVFEDYFDIGYDETLALDGTHVTQMMGQTWSSTARPDLSTYNYFYNFLDGHLKSDSNSDELATMFYRCVRGDEIGTTGDYTDNGDATITDNNTGMMWQESNGEESDGDYQFTWANALDYCENLELAGHTDWRLPNVKTLHTIVDYTNADEAIDTDTFIHNVDTQNTGPFFWSSTNDEYFVDYANYICFGPCWNYTFTMDVHGPGAQRSEYRRDNGNLPESMGDQEDLIQADNYVRCVRDASGDDAGTSSGEETFADVSSDRWGYEYIEILAANSITSGCDAENYCPENELQRSEMAIFLLRSKNGSSYVPSSATGTVFDDVSADYWAGNFVEDLADQGITSGCDDSNFCPSREITRSEMAIFLLRTKYGSDYTPSTATGTVYGDISSDYWAASFIEQLYNEGFATDTLDTTRECDEGNFCPSLAINRAEMAVFLVKTFGLE
ncbi:MAG: DUF1566 domain-containing protein [Magnetococcales bacterium]|nr:DUF1566 domain-containing protein [Magnetococcales bacterium]